MRTSKKIIRLRQKHPLLTGSEIGRTLNVSKQYVSKILKREGLNNRQPHYKKKITTCLYCQKVTPNKQKFCPKSSCAKEYYYIDVECSFCHYKFKMQRSHIIQRYNRGMQHIYCSNRCYCSGQKDVISKGGNKRSTFRAMGS